MAVRLTYTQRLARKTPRLVKHTRQWLRTLSQGRPDTRFVFVVGSQRSGTRLPLQVLDFSPDIITYSEGSAPFFERVLLEPLERVEALGRRSVFPVIALKPICETHRVNELLDRFPRSRAVWIFRDYRDAVNSASVKWTSGREAVRRLASERPESAGWRAGGLSKERLQLVQQLYSDQMSLHEANAVMWYLRNGLFFDLAADRRAEVLLVRYEDLVSQPQEQFGDVFRFLGLPPPVGLDRGIRESKGRSREFPAIAPEIRGLCDGLQSRLLDHYSHRRAASTIAPQDA